VSYLAEKSKFSYGKDVRMIYKDTNVGNFFFDSNVVNTQIMVLFCSDYAEFAIPNYNET